MAGFTVPIGEKIYFDAITSDTTGQVFDADSTPTFEVFEEDDDTAIYTGNFSKRSGTTGIYRANFEITDTNGFEIGKFYSVIGSATVNGVSGKCVCLIFRVGPAESGVGVVNANITNVDAAATKDIADGILDRDMAVGVDSGSDSVRTVRQALRFLRNRWYIDGGVLYVMKEDDSNTSWTAIPLTDISAEPITGVNPQGGSS